MDGVMAGDIAQQLAAALQEFKLVVIDEAACSRCGKGISYDHPLCMDCEDICSFGGMGFERTARAELTKGLWHIQQQPENSPPVPCAGCAGASGKPVAGIYCLGTEIECRYAFYLCAACGVYTVQGRVFARPQAEGWEGEPRTWVLGPLSKADGDRDIELIASCPSPDDEFCTCEAHEAFIERGEWK